LSKVTNEIKFVFQAISSYVVSIFLILDTTIWDINKWLILFAGEGNRIIRTLGGSIGIVWRVLKWMEGWFFGISNWSTRLWQPNNVEILSKSKTLVAKLYNARYFPTLLFFILILVVIWVAVILFENHIKNLLIVVGEEYEMKVTLKQCLNFDFKRRMVCTGGKMGRHRQVDPFNSPFLVRQIKIFSKML
jgi:hypothetical protein